MNFPPPTPEQLKVLQAKQGESDRKEYGEFLEAHKRGVCYMCSQSYGYFDRSRPCIHWVLRPAGATKADVCSALRLFGLFRVEAFMRWLANAEAFGLNINNLKQEGDPDKIIETSIRYKELEWSFACSRGDFDGHAGKRHDFPHFHFQMRIGGGQFFNYSDEHIPLTDYDRFIIAVKEGKIPWLKYANIHGPGMQDLLDALEFAEDPLRGILQGEDEGRAQFKLESIVAADPGTTISGDKVAELLKESKATGVPMATLAKKLENVKITTVISPAPGVINKAVRPPKAR